VTVTVRVTILETFPALSTFMYWTVYTPTTAVFTDPDIWNDPVAPYVPPRVDPLPSTLSVHEAPESVYEPPCAIVIVPLHTKLTTGGV